VEDRAVARVHVGRVDGAAAERETGSDVAAAAAESLRLLRRHAVIAVPLKSEQLTGIVLSSAFLVDKELWDDFVAAVDDQRQRNPGLALDVSGPWPPFDFVRMQFGGCRDAGDACSALRAGRGAARLPRHARDATTPCPRSSPRH